MEIGSTHPMAAAYVDLVGMALILNSGDKVPIVELLDEFGGECDPGNAAWAIADNGRVHWTVEINFVPRGKMH